jgi:hypothetical protein
VAATHEEYVHATVAATHEEYVHVTVAATPEEYVVISSSIERKHECDIPT